MTANVKENIKKSKERRGAYSLHGGGFHGHNGLDVKPIVHLCKIYISPVLLYGLELIKLPTTSVEKSLARRQLLITIMRALAGSLLSSTCNGSMT
jgi:hypothetical protein